MTNSSLNKKYLVEELEILFAKEVLLYNNKVCLEWETILYDPLHYEELLGGTIYWQYTQLIYDRIEHLNKFEATRFFALSIAQFESHTPDSRLNEYSKEYCKAKCILLNKESSISSLDLTNIKQSWHFYERYFPAYKIATENAFEDYKSGVLSIQSTKKISVPTSTKNIKTENFHVFINLLLGYQLYTTSPLVFHEKISNNIRYTKFDIIETLLELCLDDRKPYLNGLIFRLSDFIKKTYVTSSIVDSCLTKHKIKLPNNHCSIDNDNQLHNILSCIPMQVKNKFTAKYNKKWFEIQTLYFNFYYGFYLNDLLSFIEIQFLELNPKQPLLLHPPAIPHKKLKVNITVPQLTFLFKMLNDLKPDIFDIETKKELSNFIADNFITEVTKKDGIKEGSVYNLLTDTDKKTAIFWTEKLAKMLQDARHI